MNIRIAPAAEKELKKLPKFDQLAVGQKIRYLGQANSAGEEKLSGFSHVYRVRVGHLRIVYHKTKTEIYIILIRHRKDVYKKLLDLLH